MGNDIDDDDKMVDALTYLDSLNESIKEGMIGKKMEYNDFLQNKLDTAMQEYDTPEKQQARAELMKQYLAKGGSVEKVPAGQKAFVGKKLKPAFKKDKNGTPITSPGSDESVEEDAGNRDDLERAYMLAVRHHEGPGEDEGTGDGNYSEDVGDLLMDYYEKTGQKPDHEQIERIYNKIDDKKEHYADILQAEGITGKIWLELAKKHYGGELGMKIDEPITYLSLIHI